MYSAGVGIWNLNVVRFSSPIYGTIGSAQTRWSQQNFPIRMSQPELELDVIFNSRETYVLFQRFVRMHQLNALVMDDLVTLFWPERSIYDWTGVIKSFRGGLDRFTYAPAATFQVDLVDSMDSVRTEIATTVSGMAYWSSVVGVGTPSGVLGPPTPQEYEIATGGMGVGRKVFSRAS